MSDTKLREAVVFLLGQEVRRLKRESAAASSWEFGYSLEGARLGRRIDEEIEVAKELAQELEPEADE